MRKVQRKFSGLARCLQLEGGVETYLLKDDIQLVVPVSSCLDQTVVALSADGSATEDSQITAALEAGVYRIAWVFSQMTVAATNNISYVLVNLGTIVAPILLCTIAKIHTRGIDHSSTASGSCEINLPEGAKIEAIAGALGAGNLASLRVVIQPL